MLEVRCEPWGIIRRFNGEHWVKLYQRNQWLQMGRKVKKGERPMVDNTRGWFVLQYFSFEQTEPIKIRVPRDEAWLRELESSQKKWKKSVKNGQYLGFEEV